MSLHYTVHLQNIHWQEKKNLIWNLNLFNLLTYYLEIILESFGFFFFKKSGPDSLFTVVLCHDLDFDFCQTVMETQMPSHKNWFFAVNSAGLLFFSTTDVLRVAVNKVSVNWRPQGTVAFLHSLPHPKVRGQLMSPSIHLAWQTLHHWLHHGLFFFFLSTSISELISHLWQFCFALLHVPQAFVFQREARVCPTCSLILSYITGCINKWLTEPRCQRQANLIGRKQVSSKQLPMSFRNDTVAGQRPNSLKVKRDSSKCFLNDQQLWIGLIICIVFIPLIGCTS